MYWHFLTTVLKGWKKWKRSREWPNFLKKLSSSNSCCYKNNFLNLKQSHKKVSPPTKRNKTYRVIQNNAQIVFEKECSSRWRREVSQTLRRNYLLTTEASNCCQLRVHQKQLQPTPRQPNEKQCKQNKFVRNVISNSFVLVIGTLHRTTKLFTVIVCLEIWAGALVYWLWEETHVL